MEDALIIYGGNILRGDVTLSGAKNISLKIMIAALMFENEVILENVPRIVDVIELLDLIKALGGKAEFIAQNTLRIDGRTLKEKTVDLLFSSKIRVSFMLFAPLLYRFGSCSVPNPGGCRIGARPIDRIVDGMRAIGIDVHYHSETGYYDATVRSPIKGSYTFLKVSHTATELLILLSLMAAEPVRINNAALEPEIDELIAFLNASNAQIAREGRAIVIRPGGKLFATKPFRIIADRNEAVTYATMALTTKGDVRIHGINRKHMEYFDRKIGEIGGGIAYEGTITRYYYKGLLRASKIETAPHPGFMTDWQPNWAVLMTQAQGASLIIERVFENRFAYVEELRKLGAIIDFVKAPVPNPMEYFFFNFDPKKVYNQAIRIEGPKHLHGGALHINDLRAGASLAVAALSAEGESIIIGSTILARGYENFVDKVRALGGLIQISEIDNA